MIHKSDLELNNPLTRQTILEDRLSGKTPLVAIDLAEEFGVSLDTIRRDLLALEDRGLVRRVRGGAMPVRQPAAPFSLRVNHPSTDCREIVPACLPMIEKGMTIVMDGGTTLTYLAEILPVDRDLFVITPSPVIAERLLKKAIPTHLIGGRVCPLGGIAVGRQAEEALEDLTADLCFMGICGLDAEFGLSSDDSDEASLRRVMTQISNRTILPCAKDKIGTRARYRVLAPDQLDIIITDSDASMTAPFKAAGAEIIHV